MKDGGEHMYTVQVEAANKLGAQGSHSILY